MNTLRFLFGAFLMIGCTALASGQKVAVIDVTDILENYDEYRTAQERLDNMAITWRKEIDQSYDEIKAMYNKYQAERVLLSEELRQQRENEIVEKEEAARELQRQKFGPEGELYKRRLELIRPVQDKVYAEIEKYANSRGYDLIFDRNSASGLIFAGDDYDKTQEIKDKLGIQ